MNGSFNRPVGPCLFRSVTPESLNRNISCPACLLTRERIERDSPISEHREQPDWIRKAHGIGDDIISDERTLLAELAAVVHGWPTSNCVVRKALDIAAMELLDMAGKEPAAPELV